MHWRAATASSTCMVRAIAAISRVGYPLSRSGAGHRRPRPAHRPHWVRCLPIADAFVTARPDLQARRDFGCDGQGRRRMAAPMVLPLNPGRGRGRRRWCRTQTPPWQADHRRKADDRCRAKAPTALRPSIACHENAVYWGFRDTQPDRVYALVVQVGRLGPGSEGGSRPWLSDRSGNGPNGDAGQSLITLRGGEYILATSQCPTDTMSSPPIIRASA